VAVCEVHRDCLLISDLKNRAQKMEKDSTQYGVVMVTAASRLEAETIAKALLEAKLAACITLLPVQSIYTWQGKVEQNEE